MQGLIDRIKPKFQSNLHSFGQWLLYPQGWQTGTLDADNPIYVALGGTDANPAIAGFNPGQSADTLYVTNGETTDYADTHAGTVAYTPELGEGAPGAGFVFPDDEALVQAEFERMLPFHLGLARSAVDPDDPVSPVGIKVKPFYLDQDEIDPQNGHQSLFDFKFDVSYGDPQEVRVLAKRSLGAVRLAVPDQRRPDSQPTSTSEWNGGERYGPGNGAYYHVVAGAVRGTAPGDEVTVWFEGGRQRSDSFTYRVASDTGRRVLIVAAEDYTGASPASRRHRAAVPRLLHRRARRQRRRRTTSTTSTRTGAPRRTTSACSATTTPSSGTRATTSSRASPAGGRATRRGWRCRSSTRCATSSTRAGACSTPASAPGSSTRPALGTQLYDPFENRQCSSDPAVEARCLPLHGSGDSQGDPIEYWFGAAITTPGGGFDPNTGDPFPIAGLADPLAGLDARAQRRRQRPEPGDRLVVHRDRGLPRGDRPGGELPAVRERALGRVRRAASRARSTRTPDRRSCGRSAPTRRTSG